MSTCLIQLSGLSNLELREIFARAGREQADNRTLYWFAAALCNASDSDLSILRFSALMMIEKYQLE